MVIISFLSIITALLVVTSTSTVYSVLWLVSTFLIISALLGFINLGFTALLYIIVYVGAIAILFLFVVQLLDLGSISEQPLIDNNTKYLNNEKSITPLITTLSIALFTILSITSYLSTDKTLVSLFYDSNFNDIGSLLEINNSNILSITSTALAGNTPHVFSIAEWFYGPGLLPLIIISIILLVSMIAPISLCKDLD